MPRYDARCDMEIPVTIIVDGPPRRHETYTSNLGLRGAFLNSGMSAVLEDERLTLIARPTEEDPIEIQARILRKEEDGIAVKFLDLFPEKKELLWNYLRAHLDIATACPYCGERIVNGENYCLCGLSLNFTDRKYLDIHETEIIAREMESLDAATMKLNLRMREIESHFQADPESEDTLLAELTGATHDFVKVAETFEEFTGPDSQILQQKQVEFRRATPLFLKSRFGKHARTWPRGYPGDFQILEDTYRNTPLSEGLGYLLDRHWLNTELARGVQSRLASTRAILSGELARKRNMSVLNIACGSCRELVELVPEIISSGAKFTVLDLDPEALKFAVTRLSMVGVDGQVKPVRYNVMRMVSRTRNQKEFGAQDFIYSMGLFDYLEDELIVRLLGSLYDLLLPSGKLLVTFKDCERYISQEYHWLVDWNYFHLRTQRDCLDLLEQTGISLSNVEFRRDETGVIMFFIMTRESGNGHPPTGHAKKE